MDHLQIVENGDRSGRIEERVRGSRRKDRQNRAIGVRKRATRVIDFILRPNRKLESRCRLMSEEKRGG